VHTDASTTRHHRITKQARVSINASNHSHSLQQLFLSDGTVQVLAIDLPSGMVCVNGSTSRLDNSVGNSTWHAGGPGYAADGPYFLVGAQNNIVALRCNVADGPY
jgi:hypothetical protein